nr:protein FAR1-RELATED SEQUENCE 5-like [Ipomoea batatas]
MADMEVISEQNFGQTSHENADRNTMQGTQFVPDEEDINREARVGEDCENEDDEEGEYECIPDCDGSIKPHLGQRFKTLDEGVRYYKEYAAFVGFDVRASTVKKNRYGGVELRYLLCSREGYTVTKAQRSSTTVENNGAKINTRRRVSNRVGCMARCALKQQKDGLYAINETEASTEYKDENKLVGKVWNEFNNYMALSKGSILDLQGILNFMQDKKGEMMKRKGMIEAKRKSSDLVETFYGTQTSTTITIKPPPISKNKGSGKRLKSVREKAAEMKKIDGRKCNGCGQKPARHDFRNCHMNPKNQNKGNENDKAHGAPETDEPPEKPRLSYFVLPNKRLNRNATPGELPNWKRRWVAYRRSTFSTLTVEISALVAGVME